MENLLKVLREQAFDKKPTVEELKKFDGLDSITAKERDEAWKLIQDEKQAQSQVDSGETSPGTGTSEGSQGDDQSKVIEGAQKKDDAAAKAAKSDAEKKTTTATTTTTVTQDDGKGKGGKTQAPRYRVTVMRDGFRRLGRAWTGSSEVELTDSEFAVLEADPMFNVVEL